ncbi:MAG: hydantoinase/oxoprolinase N-terminal domain-containing protein [Alphaproteobacteria bacterium]
MRQAMQWLGVDVGGTFTDLVLYDQPSGTLRVDKVPSTPDDPPVGILAGIARIGIVLSEVAKLAQGTTEVVSKRLAQCHPAPLDQPDPCTTGSPRSRSFRE